MKNYTGKTKTKKSNKNYNNQNSENKKQSTKESALVEITVDKLNMDLIGVTLINEKPRLVKNALPYELLEAKEEYVNGVGKVYNPVKIVEPSEFRVKPKCKIYEQCGNCNLLHMRYDRQCKEKVIMLKKYLHNVADIYIDDCVPSLDEGYRNKLHVAFGENASGIFLGFVNEETHKLVEVKECKMHGKWFSSLCQIIVEWATKEALDVYIPSRQSGALRFAVARVIGDTLMLTIVSTKNIKDKMLSLYDKLSCAFSSVSLYLNVNNQKNSMVFSENFIHIAGQKSQSGELLGIKYSISPNSFFQTNEYITEKIYSKISDIVKASKCSTVLDLYSGIGITSMLFAKSGKKVVSIELVPEAVENARQLARLNGLESKIKMLCGDCKDILPTLKHGNNTIFFVDPPRKGLGFSVCQDITKFRPQTIIYLSCSPSSLAQDLSVFTHRGYSIKSITPYDMFPNTRHVETLVVLERK